MNKIKNFFSFGFGWPVVILIAILVIMTVLKPFDGSTSENKQPLSIICGIQHCYIDCDYEFISAAESCMPTQWGPKPPQVTIPEGCPCSVELYNEIMMQREVVYTGTSCNIKEFNCTCRCQ